MPVLMLALQRQIFFIIKSSQLLDFYLSVWYELWGLGFFGFVCVGFFFSFLSIFYTFAMKNIPFYL